MQYEVEVTIAADVPTVWQVLVDFPAYGEWNPFTPRVRTKLEVGGSVSMRVRFGVLCIPQRHRIREVREQSALSWGFSFRPLLWAERTQSVEGLPDGRTHYRSVDRIEGLLSGPTELFVGATLRRGFRRMAEAFRLRCEAVAEETREGNSRGRE